MELRHLRAFSAIAESHSFSKAARQLRVAQPPLSRHISQLERELGVKLFVRAASGVELTREGALLLEQARTVLADTAGFFDLASRAKAGLVNPLRVAMAPGMCEAVNRIRMHLIDRSPNLVIEGVDMASSGQHDALRRRTVDVGLLRHVADDPDIEFEPLFAERFVVMVSEKSPLARCKSLRLKQLVGERLLLQDRDWALLAHEKILALCSAAQVTPRIVTLEAIPGNQAAMLAVVSGEAICLALRGAISRSYQPARGVAVVPLDEPHADFQVQVAWRKGETSAMVCEFLTSAREVFPPKPVERGT
jgi:DNA-binding transcriptional LysR family regulator